jgi:restriction endonuclease S subunit
VADGKIPVYSANVIEPFGYIDELLISDFSVPSVLWGIDGDWMTSYMSENNEFYPTDHCGVLRCKTTEVNPRYLAHILEKEGKKMGFSRSYRASIDRIEGIAFTVPDKAVQDEAIDQIKKIETLILEEENRLKTLSGKTAEIISHYLN